ncbi:DUF397 domain-containing protein [Streptomyces sp. NA02950]|uniref:DUF397 domain-containing protein n=1 Tax=Streptomyces sp. NA02950 TaxID=2742137 RepID=UPI0015923DB8|nr:DUF397 domain-containing protein [Streptomyces sp. NA02950]QKV97415.1 DUF397 domain-containing protein [Streptomyces sp. NA02950]
MSALSTPSVEAGGWLRSSYSVGMNNCVETARLGSGLLAVRDSKNTAGPALLFTPSSWTSFLEGLSGGGFGSGPSHAAGS